LPCEVDAGKTHALYTPGTLRITLPKTARAKATRVRIPVRA
jgi:HSP20 family molecular chaperone IbpA